MLKVVFLDFLHTVRHSKDWNCNKLDNVRWHKILALMNNIESRYPLQFL